ncbi:MAG: exopolysaccharide biosynthesis protein [Ilumatobacteraceae bacterium]
MNSGTRFSDELEHWLDSDASKSLGALGDVFAERSFAVASLLLMVVSATPIPTGGVNLVFQMMAAVIAAQMALGRRTIWLPERWRRRELGGMVTGKAIPFLVRRIRWLEKYSRPRLAGLFHQRLFIRLVGVVLTAFAIAAGLAPPLSGLETLPALGAVIVALAIILEDVVVLTIGMVVGAAGIVLFVSVGAALVRFIQRVL